MGHYTPTSAPHPRLYAPFTTPLSMPRAARLASMSLEVRAKAVVAMEEVCLSPWHVHQENCITITPTAYLTLTLMRFPILTRLASDVHCIFVQAERKRLMEAEGIGAAEEVEEAEDAKRCKVNSIMFAGTPHDA